jgi:AraC-like DNA-binding protein
LADVLRQVHTLETEPTLRFPFLGHPGVLTWAEVQAGGPDPLVLSVLVSLDGLTASWSAGDSIEFRAHLQGLRKAGLPPGHPLVPNLARFLHTVFALPVTGGPADWAEALAHRSDGWFGREGDPEPAGENQVVALILRKISEDCMLDLSLKQIAGQLGLSANYISTLFHRETKTTFVRYLTGVRMDRAAALLKDSQIPLGEVARLCGYANRAYFEKVFQTVHGVGPAEYRAAREVRAGRNSPQTYGASGPTR